MTADECVARQCAHENLLASALLVLRDLIEIVGDDPTAHDWPMIALLPRARSVVGSADLQGPRG